MRRSVAPVRARRVVPILVGAGLAVGGSTAAWGLDDKNRPPWRVFKVTSLTWTVSEDAVTDDESCRTPVRLALLWFLSDFPARPTCAPGKLSLSFPASEGRGTE